MTRVLVTGGAGFIGSHICLLLLEKGFEVVVIDSFVNSSIKSLKRDSWLEKEPKTLYNRLVKTMILIIILNNNIIYLNHVIIIYISKWVYDS